MKTRTLRTRPAPGIREHIRGHKGCEKLGSLERAPKAPPVCRTQTPAACIARLGPRHPSMGSICGGRTVRVCQNLHWETRQLPGAPVHPRTVAHSTHVNLPPGPTTPPRTWGRQRDIHCGCFWCALDTSDKRVQARVQAGRSGKRTTATTPPWASSSRPGRLIEDV
ncbi:hypothetical protein FIBSPDRAFT_934144 [Athelia psychrophila]|uniref:Uncharacterized protein n=1 Tax=Athelia psychrophila TaxID=1759441 RepID=A0A166FYN9_9AGAM|nr:hypothetical protein FIBSPDRAFT_934144 [Fibularhizoctonia sp. CBS 109695]